MSLSLTASITAMAPGLSTSFLGVGGTAPYVYSVNPGGAGGTVNASTGLYTAPAVLNPDPALGTDTVVVTDSLAATATLPIKITDPLGLFCDVIQHQLGLANGRVYFWDQKLMQPTDSDLYVAVSIMSCKPFGNTNTFDGNGTSNQSINMVALLGVDIISRGPAARLRKEEVVMALNSNYAQSQQELNSFYIGKLPPSSQFTNLSGIDGAAIPFRFHIAINIHYFARKVQAVPYFDTFATPEITTES